jgi:hypothetical protein
MNTLTVAPKFKRIWLLQQPTISRGGSIPDVGPALVHMETGGEFRTLVASGVYAHNDTMGLRRDMQRRLEEVDAPETDAFLWVGGDPLVLLLTGVALADLDHSEITWLKYEREKDPETGVRNGGFFYRPILVNLETLI